MTSKNFRAPILHYIKLCASSQIHGWIQTGVTARKYSIPVKIGDFLSRVTLKSDRWHWKTKWHLSYVALSSMHHYIVIWEFQLKLQSGNPRFRSKSAIFCPNVVSVGFELIAKQNEFHQLVWYVCVGYSLRWLCETQKQFTWRAA